MREPAWQSPVAAIHGNKSFMDVVELWMSRDECFWAFLAKSLIFRQAMQKRWDGCAKLATEMPFLQLRKATKSLNRPSCAERIQKWMTRPEFGTLPGVLMEDTVQKSCWGITARAVIGFSGILALAHLFGGI